MRPRIEPEDLGVAAGGVDEAEDERDGGRLAGSVRAQEAIDAAAPHLQVQVVQGEQPPVAFAQTYRPQDDVSVGGGARRGGRQIERTTRNVAPRAERTLLPGPRLHGGSPA